MDLQYLVPNSIIQITSELFNIKKNIIRKENFIDFLTKKNRNKYFECWEDTVDLIFSIKYVMNFDDVKDRNEKSMMKLVESYIIAIPNSKAMRLEDSLMKELIKHHSTLKLAEKNQDISEEMKNKQNCTTMRLLQELEMVLEEHLRDNIKEFLENYFISLEESYLLQLDENVFKISKFEFSKLNEKYKKKYGQFKIQNFEIKKVMAILTEKNLKFYKLSFEDHKNNNNKLELLTSLPLNEILVDIIGVKKNKLLITKNEDAYLFNFNTKNELSDWFLSILKIRTERVILFICYFSFIFILFLFFIFIYCFYLFCFYFIFLLIDFLLFHLFFILFLLF